MQRVSHHAYSLRPDLTLAPHPCGYDPLRQPRAFRDSLRRDLQSLSLPSHSSIDGPAAQLVVPPTELELSADEPGRQNGGESNVHGSIHTSEGRLHFHEEEVCVKLM